MKNKFCLFLSTLFLSLILSLPAFAGTWKQDNIGWWYQRDDKSYPISTWEQINNSWYYFNENGYMLSNQWVGNYYVDDNGVMLTNNTIDGKQLGANGAYNSSSNATTVVNNNSNNNGATNNQTSAYILNKNTHKFHYPTCSAVKKMKEKNKVSFSGTRDEAVSKGYSPCGICKP